MNAKMTLTVHAGAFTSPDSWVRKLESSTLSKSGARPDYKCMRLYTHFIVTTIKLPHSVVPSRIQQTTSNRSQWSHSFPAGAHALPASPAYGRQHL